MRHRAFAPIAGGWFTMGTELGHEDERPPHRVFVDPFELGIYPVTRTDYERFVDDTSHETPCDWLHQPFTRADLPVVGVSWQDAVAYCAWRSSQDARAVRLPTEAEWECAARGRQQALYPWGEGVPGWIPAGGRGPLSAPWPVTLGEPNDFGLFGIATNVHEWCADWHDADYYSRSPERHVAGPTRAGGVPHAAAPGVTRRRSAVSHYAASSTRPSATTTSDSAWREPLKGWLTLAW